MSLSGLALAADAAYIRCTPASGRTFDGLDPDAGGGAEALPGQQLRRPETKRPTYIGLPLEDEPLAECGDKTLIESVETVRRPRPRGRLANGGRPGVDGIYSDDSALAVSARHRVFDAP